MFAADSQVTVELIRLIPPLVWATTIVAIALIFRRTIRERLLPRLEGFEAFGVKATFVRAQLDRVAEDAPEAAFVGDAGERTQVARRAERLAPIIAGASVLLVNDQQHEMRRVVAILNELGITVTQAVSTDHALGLLAKREFDAVISDMSRGNVPDEGQRFLAEARRRGIDRPTIFTVARYEPERGTPPFAFGITTKVDDLLHLVFDALERSRG